MERQSPSLDTHQRHLYFLILANMCLYSLSSFWGFDIVDGFLAQKYEKVYHDWKNDVGSENSMQAATEEQQLKKIDEFS